MKKELSLATLFFLMAIYFANTVIVETNNLMIVVELFAVCVFIVLGSVSVMAITLEQLSKEDYEA